MIDVPRPRSTAPLFASVKPGVATVNGNVVVTVFVPKLPVTVTVDVPCVAALLAVSVSWLVPVVGLGENDAVTPLCNPATARSTLP